MVAVGNDFDVALVAGMIAIGFGGYRCVRLLISADVEYRTLYARRQRHDVRHSCHPVDEAFSADDEPPARHHHQGLAAPFGNRRLRLGENLIEIIAGKKVALQLRRPRTVAAAMGRQKNQL
jgi:hypothetical protein